VILIGSLVACSSGHGGPAPPAWQGFAVELERYGEFPVAASIETDGAYVAGKAGSGVVSSDNAAKLRAAFWGDSFDTYQEDALTVAELETVVDSGEVYFLGVVPGSEDPPLVDGYFLPGSGDLEPTTENMLAVVGAVLDEIGGSE